MAAHTVSELDVRPDLAAAQVEFIAQLADPGTWWTGAERIALAEEVRRAREHSDLAPWSAPSTISGTIPDDHRLPAIAVDAVWRITNHPGTLTINWYRSIVDGLDPLHYVELVGVVAALNAVDRFADAMGIDRLALPTARPGDPTRVTVDAGVTTHWVPTAGHGGANVMRALSAVPAAWEATRAIGATHYAPQDKIVGDLAWDRGVLTRAQIEYVAAMTSSLNECFY